MNIDDFDFKPPSFIPFKRKYVIALSFLSLYGLITFDLCSNIYDSNNHSSQIKYICSYLLWK